MSLCVFVGPTLSTADVQSVCDAVCLPPAGQGDVYRALAMRPRAIAIVDGVFEGVPSVWHKEILFAMAEGVHVFGSASMGALRAAELHLFGMQGVGRIFEAYRDGVLEDDDEVAVLHGPEEAGFVVLSEPMVNIRATLERARQEEIVGPKTCEALIARAKAIFYQERAWETVLASVRAPKDELEALRAWLPGGRVDQKRLDALAMLAALRDLLARDPEPMRVGWRFEWTEAWDELAAAPALPTRGPGRPAAAVLQERLLDELRLDEQAFSRLKLRAARRALALRESGRRRLEAEPREAKAALARFRAERSLLTHDALEGWLAAHDLEPRELERLMRDEARLDALERQLAPALAPHLLDEMRLGGDYRRLLARARAKHETLAALGLDEPEPQDLGLTPLALRIWYFETRLSQAMPEDVAGFAHARGFASLANFDRALLREYLYCREGEASPGA